MGLHKHRQHARGSHSEQTHTLATVTLAAAAPVARAPTPNHTASRTFIRPCNGGMRWALHGPRTWSKHPRIATHVVPKLAVIRTMHVKA